MSAIFILIIFLAIFVAVVAAIERIHSTEVHNINKVNSLSKRNIDLTNALSALVDLFEDNGDSYTIEVLIDGEQVPAKITDFTAEALEEAINILNDNEAEADEDTYYDES